MNANPLLPLLTESTPPFQQSDRLEPAAVNHRPSGLVACRTVVNYPSVDALASERARNRTDWNELSMKKLLLAVVCLCADIQAAPVA